ncbi:hypothetical protein SUDANB145_06351 [Streptomyces sp. enrichment culture]|uniref:alpha/beta fold hydrolase n=1 Tax=Streptomyces sp. enrichment culture TaxID=1795815 RepID=UPI003F550010
MTPARTGAGTAAHETAGPPHTRVAPTSRRRGGFFLTDEWDEETGRPVGPAWVQWEAPADEDDWRLPVVLVHGGGGQSTDWMWAVDDQPGWAELFVAAGHPTYLLDRPGHGRSPWDDRHLGPREAAPGAGLLGRLFQLDPARLRPDGAFGPVTASSTALPPDPATAQRLDAARLSRLLELTGPAILVTHSAGAPAGWLAAGRAPDLVRLVVAVEPLGPPYGGPRHARALAEGLTALPLDAARQEPDGPPRGLARVPVVVVTAAASGHLDADAATTAFLRGLGSATEHLKLAEHGLTGDGHGVVFDTNSTAAFHVVHARCVAHRAGARRCREEAREEENAQLRP